MLSKTVGNIQKGAIEVHEIDAQMTYSVYSLVPNNHICTFIFFIEEMFHSIQPYLGLDDYCFQAFQLCTNLI